MFSSDVVAFEAQTAPLWESASKQNNGSPAKKRESNRQKNKRKSLKRILNISPPPAKEKNKFPKWNVKRQKMMIEFTECKLCELKFKSELEMEEHLFSILHHRALHTEKGECQHECNLCSVTCRTLASYVQHLQDGSHKLNSIKRKKDISEGSYHTPRNKLRKFTSTFMCLPRKSKQMKLDNEIDRKIAPMFPKGNDPRNPQSSDFNRSLYDRHQSSDNRSYGEEPPLPLYNHSNDRNYNHPHGGDGHLQRPYPDWNRIGNHNNPQDFSSLYHYNHYPDYGWTEDGYNGSFQNPYNGDWGNPWCQRSHSNPRNTYWERPEYGQYRHDNINQVLPIWNESFPTNEASHNRALTEDQARTKKLVARAHRVIKSGNAISETAKCQKLKKNNKIGDRHSISSNTSKESISTSDLIYKEKRKTTVAHSSGKDPKRDNSLKQNKRRADKIESWRSQSSGRTPNTSGLSPEEQIHVRKIVSRRDPNMANISLKKLKNCSHGAFIKWRSMKRSISLESKIRPNIYNEFRKQIDVEIEKTFPEDDERSSNTQSDERAQSPEIDNKEEESPEKSSNSTNNIRAKFRQILDDIDQPVASASEILNGMQQNEDESKNDDDTEVSVEASWTHSTELISSQRSYTPTNISLTNSEENTNASINSSHSQESEEIWNRDTTQYTSLPSMTNETTDKLSSRTRTVSENFITVDDSTLTNTTDTPVRDILVTSSSDIDTSGGKKRLQPQPNFNRARSRLTAKQKDSPDAPSDIRQAKLKKLIQKYDRTKKSSPDTNKTAAIVCKKATGPRFGIELNLQGDNTDSMDMESVAERIELVEVLQEKRIRSLSESDGFASFGSANTESTINTDRPTFNSPQPKQRTIKPTAASPHSQPEIRTSTPTLSTQPTPDGLNSKLLFMSEREETLHASVRSLAIQEANAQSEIDAKVSVLRTLYAELEKMKEGKLSIDALKRRDEQELEALRGERLMLLRGSVSNSSYNPPQSSSIFQNAPPNCRRMTPPFNESSFNNSTSTTERHAQNETVHGLFGAIGTSLSNIKQESTQSKAGPITLPPDVIKETTCAPVTMIPPNFDLSRVKSESAEDITSPFVPVLQTQCQKIVCVKEENNSNEAQQVSESKTSLSNGDGNSTTFFSFNNNDSTMSANSAEVDAILAKYKNFNTKKTSKENPALISPNTNSPNGNKRGNKRLKSPRIGTRRSPRNLGKDSLEIQSPEISNSSCMDKESPGTPHQSEKPVDNEKSPKVLKTHELPLVGMHLLDGGLVTCSLDETVALHKNGEKIICENLDGTPTAMTAVSTTPGNGYVFVSTQNIISQAIETNDSAEVINKIEHYVTIFNITSWGGSSQKQGGFNVMSKIRMKTRVLCMHYDKHTLFCGMRDGMTAIVSLNSFYKPLDDINVLECHSCNAITCLTTGTEGPRRILCCGSTDCTVSIRDAVDGLLLRTIQGHLKTVTCVQIVHNELFSASVDRRVLGHDLITGNLLHRFMGHIGVVRSLCVVKDQMVTLCSDRNIRFFNVKTCRLLQKPKSLKCLPLFADIQITRLDSNIKHTVFVGCEDSTVVRIPFPSNLELSDNVSNTNIISPGENIRISDESSKVVNLTGDLECRWTGCTDPNTFTSLTALGKHVFDVHVNMYDLTEHSMDRTAATLTVGTCCQWEACTHYFAPELDTITDVQTHVQRHFIKSPVKKIQRKQRSPKKYLQGNGSCL